MDYMTLFPSYTRGLPRFSALASAILSQVDDLIAVIPDLNGAYAVSSASGEQLDALGDSVGFPRPDGMTDADYREVLQAKLVLWTWDGANDTAQGIMDLICPGSTICDNGDGTVTVSGVSTLQSAYGLYPVPAGVRAVVSD